MIHHITYTNDLMTISAEKCKQSALKWGADSSAVFTREQIPEHIIKPHENHFCDYWAWKPYIVFDQIHNLPIGSYLVYSDAGIEFVNDIRHVINCMGDQDIFLFSNGWKHSDWCKMDIFKTIGVEPGEHKQTQASLLFFKVSIKSRVFAAEWFAASAAKGLIDDSPSKHPNTPTFAENRHDQAILATLAIKYEIPLHWYPVTTAHHIKAEYSDTYPEIALHHRKRNHEWV